jgi:hypothetical protein
VLRDFKKGRTGANQTHFAAKNIPELRKFVEAPASQKTAYARDARICCGSFEAMRCISRVLHHGPEFPLVESCSIASGDPQLKENIAW